MRWKPETPLNMHGLQVLDKHSIQALVAEFMCAWPKLKPLEMEVYHVGTRPKLLHAASRLDASSKS